MSQTVPRPPIALWVLLAAGLAIRLIQVDSPPVGMHAWRQADTAAMARNYAESEAPRFAWPQIDWGGRGPGYVESEFPIYPYTISLLYRAIGIHEWIGRLLSALGFTLGAWALFLLVDAAVDRRTALWSTAFFLFLPLDVFYGRAIMPESWMIAASIAGVMFFFRWAWPERGRIRHLVASACFVALAALLKLPALYLGLPILYLAWRRYGPRFMGQPTLWIYGLAILIPVAAWYAHAHSIVRNGGMTFGIWEYGTDKWGNWSLLATMGYWNGIFARSLAERWFTWAGFPLLLLGLVLPRRSASERLFDWWLVAVIIYVLIVARGNYVHEYYQIPFMPVGAVYLGKVFARGWRSDRSITPRTALAVMLMGVITLSGIRLSEYWQKESPSRSGEVALANEIRAKTQRDDPLVTLTGGNPALLYLSHRKGWAVPVADATVETIRRFRSAGAAYVAGTGPVPATLESDRVALPVVQSPRGYLYRLR